MDGWQMERLGLTESVALQRQCKCRWLEKGIMRFCKCSDVPGLILMMMYK
jgi:hypothetical protein